MPPCRQGPAQTLAPVTPSVLQCGKSCGQRRRHSCKCDVMPSYVATLSVLYLRCRHPAAAPTMNSPLRHDHDQAAAAWWSAQIADEIGLPGVGDEWAGIAASAEDKRPKSRCTVRVWGDPSESFVGSHGTPDDRLASMA